jgi:hypothetical protein
MSEKITLFDEPTMLVETLPAQPISQSQSGVIVASWAGMFFMALGMVGLVVKPEDQQAWTSLFIQAAPLVGGLVSFGVAWWRRRRSTAPIAGAPNDPAVMGKQRAIDEAREILRGS